MHRARMETHTDDPGILSISAAAAPNRINSIFMKDDEFYQRNPYASDIQGSRMSPLLQIKEAA